MNSAKHKRAGRAASSPPQERRSRRAGALRTTHRANIDCRRLRIAIQGAVQGVGFRPFVFRLAERLNLRGFVQNSLQGLVIEAEGTSSALNRLLRSLDREVPEHSFITSLESVWLDAAGHGAFTIRPSEEGASTDALILPDIATCPECLRELFDPTNRRFRYPFINCTHCGPRFSILESLPYDRANTSMKRFVMCPACAAEYRDPRDRRFHAEPIACAACGPKLDLWNEHGAMISTQDDALRHAAHLIRVGRIVAMKGLGGFQLIARADHSRVIARIRELKQREQRPLAVMFPDVSFARSCCEVSDLEERLLRSPESPIVLLRRTINSTLVCAGVAPGNPNLGVMLPYTPLHHLLLHEVGVPVAATSGNLRDEPLCTNEHEALRRLRGIADGFLIHDRPIVRHIDDSVARVLLGRELVLRRARGYAPLPIHLREQKQHGARVVLAVGAQLKNAIALSHGNRVFVSQHIGDLETPEACAAFERVATDLQNTYRAKADTIAADLHPDYESTRAAHAAGIKLVGVQHHYAHALACLAENQIKPPALGIVWDGTGIGTDKTIWGGEFLRITHRGFSRAASFRPFRLPGGDAAAREPWRAAVGLLCEMFDKELDGCVDLPPFRLIAPSSIRVMQRMIERAVNAPVTTSAGRFFDAIASIIGLRHVSRCEGEAAMELEFAAERASTSEDYSFAFASDQCPTLPDCIRFDWEPVVRSLISDWRASIAVPVIAAKVHNTLAGMIVAMAQKIGEPRVLLSGGCFQNAYLTARAVEGLREAGFQPYWHQRIPPNDGGIALGQVVAALRSCD